MGEHGNGGEHGADRGGHAEGHIARRISLNADEGGLLGLELGERAFDLMLAWTRARHVAYLREASAGHPLLVDAATKCVPEVAAAWKDLDRTIASSGRALLEVSRQRLAGCMKRAPAADAVTSPTYSSAFAHMIHWLNHFDQMINLAGDLDVPVDSPPRRSPSAEEERLLDAIVANPEDDSLRHRFADLAAERGDARAMLVREHYAELADPHGAETHRAYKRVQAHPEWSAPLTALGARDVKFTRG